MIQRDLLRCSACAAEYPRVAGVWRMLPGDRMAYYRDFIQDYETIRQAEGRGSDAAAYYRALPYTDLSGRRIGEWAIRRRSFEALIENVIIPRENRANRPLRILDLGAGNGWLSYRLSQRGHILAAVDLLTNPLDGLGAHVHYESRFTPIQAEFDHLPLADEQAELVIYNSSLHYSVDYLATLMEALRVLVRSGQIVVIDTPIYRAAESGAAMVRERHEQFKRQYGFASDSLPSENYLTFERLQELDAALGMAWKIITPYYGLRWALRPWLAFLRGRREPARFALIIGRRR
jgi:SAM-dependent methyltransferase